MKHFDTLAINSRKAVHEDKMQLNKNQYNASVDFKKRSMRKCSFLNF